MDLCRCCFASAAAALLLQAFLIDGLESQSQARVGSALQVFFNLEELNRVRQGCRESKDNTLCGQLMLSSSAGRTESNVHHPGCSTELQHARCLMRH